MHKKICEFIKDIKLKWIKSKTSNDLSNIHHFIPADMFDQLFTKFSNTYEEMINYKDKQLKIYQRMAIESDAKIKQISSKVNKISQNLKEEDTSLLPSEKEKLIQVNASFIFLGLQ